MIMSMYKKICITNRRLVCDKLNISDYDGEEACNELLLQITKVCEAGADVIVLREKDLDACTYETLAKGAIDICERYDVLLVLHTFVDVAKRLNYPHIHVSYAQFCKMVAALEQADARNAFHFETIGVSTHTAEEAKQAGAQGASYVTISPIYETTCKPGAKAKGLDFLAEAVHNAGIPVYALGGVNESRIDECISHGAAGVCMMSEYMRL